MRTSTTFSVAAFLLYMLAAYTNCPAQQTGPDSTVETDPSSSTNTPGGGSSSNYGYMVHGNMTFHESIGVVGTPFALHYSSLRTPGYKKSYEITVRFGNPHAFPQELEAVSIQIDVAGRIFRREVQRPFTNYAWTLIWDGYDAQSNRVYGTVPAVINSTAYMKEYLRLEEYMEKSGYETGYGAFIGGTHSWNPYVVKRLPSIGSEQYYSIEGVGIFEENELITTPRIPWIEAKHKREVTYVGSRPPDFAALGGWTLNRHHSYDVSSGILHQGDGVERKVDRMGLPDCSFVITNAPPPENFVVIAADGLEYYIITPAGRHEKTVDALTGLDIFTFEYDEYDHLVRIIDQNSLTTTITRAGNGEPLNITGPYGHKTDLTITGEWLTKMANPASETNRFLYTGDGLLTNVVSRRGYTYTIIYDDAGQVVRAEDPAGGYDQATRTQGYRSSTITHISSMERTNTITTRTLWNRTTVREVTNPAGAVTITETSADGRTVKTTHPTGMISTRKTAPDPRFGARVMVPIYSEITSPSGRKRHSEMSRHYTLQVATNPLSPVMTITNIISVNGRESVVALNMQSRIMHQTSPEGRASTVEFNMDWRPIKVERPGLAPVTANYDAFGRIHSVQQSNRVITLSYTDDGYLGTITNTLGQAVRLEHDVIGRVTNIVLPDDSLIALRHQPSTGPVGVTPPDRPEHGFDYTPVGLMERYASPDIGGEADMVLTWNPARQLTGVTYPDSRSITNEYDQAGFLRVSTWPENTVTNDYSCDCGQLGGIYSTNGIGLRFSYDGALLTNITALGGPATAEVSFAYNHEFRVSGIGFTGTLEPYGYDRDGLMTNAGAMALRRHVENGFLTNSSLGLVQDHRQFNGFGEWTQYRASYDATDVYGVDFQYDALGRITSRVERLASVTNQFAYAYDLAGRLSQVWTNGTLQSMYQYDANGNRTNAVVGGVTRVGAYDDQDRLLSYGSTVYQYNDHGTLTNKIDGTNSVAYVYDTRGSLLEVRAGTNVITYLVDPLGRRIARTRNGETTQRLVYQDFLKPVATINADGSTDSRFIYVTRANVPDFIVKGEDVYRVLTDHLGSVRLVVHVETGDVIQRMDYDEWGNVLQDTFPGFQPFGFAGGLYDFDTSLVRFGYRDYDPVTGRWLAKDPILFAGGQANLYLYCNTDPVNRIDSYGLDDLSCSGTWGGEYSGTYNNTVPPGVDSEGNIVGGGQPVLQTGGALTAATGAAISGGMLLNAGASWLLRPLTSDANIDGVRIPKGIPRGVAIGTALVLLLPDCSKVFPDTDPYHPPKDP